MMLVKAVHRIEVRATVGPANLVNSVQQSDALLGRAQSA